MFTIHLTKYYLTQTQYLFLLGFETDLYKMTASLKEEKKNNMYFWCGEKSLFSRLGHYFWKFSCSLGGVSCGSLYYVHLEQKKIVTLQKSKFKFDTCIFLSNDLLHKLKWWCENIAQACK